MDIAASVKNLFKKRDFKDEIEKSLGVDRNFENVLTEVFAVFAKSEFFNRADWEATIVKSIGNVNPFLQPDLQVRPSTDSGVYAVDKVDAEAPSQSKRRRHHLKIKTEAPRRSGRVTWQAERYTYN